MRKSAIQVACFLMIFLVLVRAQDPLQVVKVGVGLVSVNVSVTDKRGRPISGLQPQDFHVTDEGRPVAVEFFDHSGPASIVFVLDTSSSMQGDKWKAVGNALKRFLAKARPDNDYTLVVFSNQARLVAQSLNAEGLWHEFRCLQLHGETAVYDGVWLGLEALSSCPSRHKALVLLSDGADNRSQKRLDEVVENAHACRATVYAVGMLHRLPNGKIHDSQREGENLLNQLAAATGGLASFPPFRDLDHELSKISADLSGQYTLSYYLPDEAPGWRKVEVSTATESERLRLRYQQRYLSGQTPSDQ